MCHSLGAHVRRKTLQSALQVLQVLPYEKERELNRNVGVLVRWGAARCRSIIEGRTLVRSYGSARKKISSIVHVFYTMVYLGLAPQVCTVQYKTDVTQLLGYAPIQYSTVSTTVVRDCTRLL
jgi:hypothetical protein